MLVSLKERKRKRLCRRRLQRCRGVTYWRRLSARVYSVCPGGALRSKGALTITSPPPTTFLAMFWVTSFKPFRYLESLEWSRSVNHYPTLQSDGAPSSDMNFSSIQYSGRSGSRTLTLCPGIVHSRAVISVLNIFLSCLNLRSSLCRHSVYRATVGVAEFFFCLKRVMFDQNKLL